MRFQALLVLVSFQFALSFQDFPEILNGAYKYTTNETPGKEDGEGRETNPDTGSINDAQVSTCSPSQFTCDNGGCISALFLRCDQKDDCGDNSDEKNCENNTCSSWQFRCDYGQCIPASWRCDGRNNCRDASDENNCAPATSKTTSAPTPSPASECSSYRILNETDRAQGFIGAFKCDRNLRKAWYRIQGGAGKQLPDSCVPEQQCGTHASGWLSGGHPTVAQGIVSRAVCFHWYGSCCRWSRNIRVRNCSAFYVYELGPTSGCFLRYCGDRKQVPLPAPECRNYRTLSDADRAQGFENRQIVKCDRSNVIPIAWYRFTGSAGYKMPDSCVPQWRCGTHAPGWLTGGHPTVAQGAVIRKVCFHWSYRGCCTWFANIRVRNCGAFYVYELIPTPTCWLRYCGNRD